MFHKAKTVDDYVSTHPLWSEELVILQSLLEKTELQPDIKWGMPVYTLKNKNVIGLTGFKHHFGLWFYQGAFLSDPDRILVNAQEGKTKGMRHVYLKSKSEIDKKQLIVYIEEAIANEKAGKRFAPAKRSRVLPPELAELFSQDELLGKAFEQLSLGKRNDYAAYIESAKRDATKISRLEKIIPMIREGIGLHDKYKRK